MDTDAHLLCVCVSWTSLYICYVCVSGTIMYDKIICEIYLARFSVEYNIIYC